jgi:hypothetical protein
MARPIEFWTYNCGNLTEERLRRFSECIHKTDTCSFMGIQGTKRTYRNDELPVTLRTLEHHDVWEVKVQWKKTGGGGSPAGVALMAPKGYRNLVQY